ncbi:MAG: Glu/Leu/Phe/Val dehydrogenase dimerization domain-containing protein, partial [Patescibacteria group bacterium]
MDGRHYLESVFKRIDETAKILQLKPYVIKELKTFSRVLEMRIRVGKQHFTAYRIRHVNPYATGHRPYKGGLRFDKDTGGDLNTIKALAVEMTLKCATVGPDPERRLPFGGAKGGIGINAKIYSKEQIRGIVEKFVDEIGELGIFVVVLVGGFEFLGIDGTVGEELPDELDPEQPEEPLLPPPPDEDPPLPPQLLAEHDDEPL